MNYVFDTMPNQTICMINKAGQKRSFIDRNIHCSYDFTNLEEKARLFYRLARVRDRKHLFRTYRSSFVGKEIVDSMTASGLTHTRAEAVALARVLAKKFNLFQSCDNNILTKLSLFEDSPVKFYSFSSGALMVVRDMDKNELESNKTDPETGVIITKLTSSNRGPGLQRQNATRTIKSDVTASIDEDERSENSRSSLKNTKSKFQSSSIQRFSFPAPMEAIAEAQNEDEDESTSKTSTQIIVVTKNKTKKECLREIQILAREQAEFEILAMETNLSEEEKKRLEETRIRRLRSLTKQIMTLQNNGSKRRGSTGGDLIMDAINDDKKVGDSTTHINTKERMMATIVAKLERNHSQNWILKYGSLLNEVDSKVSTIYTGDHHIVETQNQDPQEIVLEKNNSDIVVTPVETSQNSTNVGIEELVAHTSKAEKWKHRIEAKRQQKKKDFSEQDKPVVSGDNAHPSDDDDESKENVFPKFVLSPEDLPAGIRRRASDFTETYDTFESMMNKKSKNVLRVVEDDDVSAWTECIIQDEEDLKRYRESETEQRPSYMSYFEETVVDYDDGKSYLEFTVTDGETMYDEETVYDDETVATRWKPRVSLTKTRLSSLSRRSSANQSYMGFSTLGDGDDKTIAVSYVEDDENYVASKLPQVETLNIEETETDDRSLFHVFATRGSVMDDDDLTQITMDEALFRRKSSLNMIRRASSVELPANSSTSKKRIHKILWKDLYSNDTDIIQSSMEDLRNIVVSEAESRLHAVHMGGVAAIMGAMEEYLEEESIQYTSCVILELMASMEPEARKAINELGGIQLIIRSMGDQADSDRVQEAGRAALETIRRG